MRATDFAGENVPSGKLSGTTSDPPVGHVAKSMECRKRNKLGL